MPSNGQYDPIDLKPLSGPMDTRSSPDSVLFGSWRYRQNIMVRDRGKACRRPGWARYRHERTPYNNEDLHDQLLSLDASESDRQPITFLFEALSTSGMRKMLAGTQNRLYVLNEAKGNWQIIADAYGGDAGNGLKTMWKADRLLDTIILTNNYDAPISYVLDSPVDQDTGQAVSEIDSLAGIGLTKAGVVASWKGTIFLGDVEMDGERAESRVVWSRYNLPTNFTPGAIGTSGTAGKQDLPYGGRILAMLPLSDVLMIYTTIGIWQCRYVGGDQVFAFEERYSEPKNGEGCLAYRRTLISTGSEHYFCGRDGIYKYGLYLSRPERTEWIHAGTNRVFDTIDELACDLHVGWFYPDTKEYWLSWVKQGDAYPKETLVINTQYETSDFVDHGFLAFCNHAADDRGTVLDFLLTYGICTEQEISQVSDIVPTQTKEGGYCDDSGAVTEPDELPARNLPIWSNWPKDIDGRLVEDYERAEPDADSLCTLLGGLTLEDLCQQCPKTGVLVMVSSTDFAIKEYSAKSDVYYREVATGTLPCGTWRRDPYETILRSGAQDYGHPSQDKDSDGLELEYEKLDLQVVPSALQMRIAYSATAVDSNNNASGRCAIVWRNLRAQTLECQSLSSGVEHVQKGTRPNLVMDWNYYYTGRYFYHELRVTGVNGSVCFSRLSVSVRVHPRSPTS